MLLTGLDDTDSLSGGCTTHLAVRLLEELVIKGDLALIGPPRLVRLNPNVPWKTRGNGAVALAMGLGEGQPFPVGQVAGKPLAAYPTYDPSPPIREPEELLELATPIIEAWAQLADKNTNPGLVVATSPLPPRLYWQRVRTVVDYRAHAEWLARRKIVHRSWGNGRGLVGAVGGLAWPAGWVTYELLTYRQKERWGTPRRLDSEGLQRLAREPGTFDSYNPHRDKVVVAPAGPDPVLFGLRGLEPELLVGAAEDLSAEPVADWLIWATNQGSDDHLQFAPLGRVGPRGGYRVRGQVVDKPTKGAGGHLLFRVRDGSGTLACAAFEPGKPLPAELERLRPGDEVEVCGGTHAASTLTLAIEKLRFIYSSSAPTKVGNPRCPSCDKAMKSVGAGAGYRCRSCGTKAPEGAARYTPPSKTETLAPGWYEPPPGQRRHLARPKVLLEAGYWNWERVNWPPFDSSGPEVSPRNSRSVSLSSP